MLTDAGRWLGTLSSTHRKQTANTSTSCPEWKYAPVHGPAIVWARPPLPLTPTVLLGHKNYQCHLVSNECLINKEQLSQDPLVCEWGLGVGVEQTRWLCWAAMQCCHQGALSLKGWDRIRLKSCRWLKVRAENVIFSLTTKRCHKRIINTPGSSIIKLPAAAPTGEFSDSHRLGGNSVSLQRTIPTSPQLVFCSRKLMIPSMLSELKLNGLFSINLSVNLRSD